MAREVLEQRRVRGGDRGVAVREDQHRQRVASAGRRVDDAVRAGCAEVIERGVRLPQQGREAARLGDPLAKVRCGIAGGAVDGRIPRDDPHLPRFRFVGKRIGSRLVDKAERGGADGEGAGRPRQRDGRRHLRGVGHRRGCGTQPERAEDEMARHRGRSLPAFARHCYDELRRGRLRPRSRLGPGANLANLIALAMIKSCCGSEPS